MPNGRNEIRIISQIPNKFYKRYEITHNNKIPISSIIFRYSNALLGGYNCDNCFSLLEGNLEENWNINKKEEDNFDIKRYYFNNSQRVLFRFNPQRKLWETSKKWASGLLISIMAGLILFIITKRDQKHSKIKRIVLLQDKI